MTSYLNDVRACGSRGSIPVGTGNGNQLTFVEGLNVPTNSTTGAILPGYSLQTSPSSNAGINWSYTGAGGKTVTTFQYPTNCPVPFPSPSELQSDLVLITREDPLTAENGITDLYMPVIGTQGSVPTHSIRSVCDVDNQLVFFFDDTNAAINVYSIRTKVWKMGWLRAVDTYDFKWRAADVLTTSKLNISTPYAAPYNSQGIMFSCISSRFTNGAVPASSVQPSPHTPGLYFQQYTVSAAGTINDAVLPGGFSVPTTTHYMNDIAVSSILILNQNTSSFRAPPNYPNVTQMVAAISVTRLTTINNGFSWWGFLGTISTHTNKLINPDMSSVESTSSEHFSVKDDSNAAVGDILTISLDPFSLYFFIGGSYNAIRFSNVVVVISQPLVPSGTYNQTLAVASEYRYNGFGAMTAANYLVIGQNASTVGACRPWSGTVAGSNFADNCFAYYGDFRTPSSQLITTLTAGPDLTVPPFNAVAPSQAGAIVSPSAVLVAPTNTKGGTLNTVEVLYFDDDVDFPNDGDIYGLNNVALQIVPNDGDLRQSNFPPVVIGGNYLQPLTYFTETAFKFQTKAPVIAANFWMSYVEIYSEIAYTTPMTILVYLYPDTVTGQNYATIPIQFFLLNQTLTKGKNYINILGGGSQVLFNPIRNGGNLRNANRTAQGGNFNSLTTPRNWFMDLFFYAADTVTPVNVSLGINTNSGQAYPGCWNLYGYPTAGITATSSGPGFFSSRALQLGQCVQNKGIAVGRTSLSYSNLNTPIPLNTTTLAITSVPLNWNIAKATYASDPTLPFSLSAIVRVSTSRDRNGDFEDSCLNLAVVPSNVYDVPSMSSSDAVPAVLSLYMNSRLEIYKNAWAHADQSALGVYTNFQQTPTVQYQFVTNGADVTGAANAGRASFNAANTLLNLNTYNIYNQSSQFNWTTLQAGDMLEIAFKLSSTIGRFKVISVTQNNATYLATFNLSVEFGPFAYQNAFTGITFIYSRNPRETPFVLKENLGPYLIGNGSSPTVSRDVYLSSYQPTGKAYRYVPDYETAFVNFKTGLYLGAPTVDDTILTDTVLFNTNSSSILLSKTADAAGGSEYWNVASTFGNIGFNNQKP